MVCFEKIGRLFDRLKGVKKDPSVHRFYVLIDYRNATCVGRGSGYFLEKQGILAYFYPETKQVKRLKTDLVQMRKVKTEPSLFKKGYEEWLQDLAICKIEARPFVEPFVELPSGKLWKNLSSTKVKFELVRVLKRKKAFCPALKPIREEYMRYYLEPIVLEDERFGRLKLPKYGGYFNGRVEWMGKDIGMHIRVHPKQPATWPAAVEAFKKIVDEQQIWDSRLREIATRKLLKEYNDNFRTEDSPKLSPAEFAERLTLWGIRLERNGSVAAEYYDEDLFDDPVFVWYNPKTGAGKVQVYV